MPLWFRIEVYFQQNIKSTNHLKIYLKSTIVDSYQSTELPGSHGTQECGKNIFYNYEPGRGGAITIGVFHRNT